MCDGDVAVGLLVDFLLSNKPMHTLHRSMKTNQPIMCKTENTKSRPGEKVPAICQFWINLHDALPSMHLFGLDVSVTVFSTLFLTAVRYTANYVLVEFFNWPVNNYEMKYASASVASIVHSLSLVSGLMSYFANHTYNPSESLNNNNNNKSVPAWCEPTATALLQFCTGYMVYDGVINCWWLNYSMKPEVLQGEALVFLGHHIATILYMFSTRILGAGHQSAMICMLLGELTNPLHNSYFIASMAQELDCCNGEFSQRAFNVIEFNFSLAYFVMRALVAPVAFVHLTFCLWWRRNPRIPFWVLGIWTFLIWGVEIGSIPYIEECWKNTLKHLPESISSALLAATAGSAEL